jgi:hypothetical protein
MDVCASFPVHCTLSTVYSIISLTLWSNRRQEYQVLKCHMIRVHVQGEVRVRERVGKLLSLCAAH